ncbi:uncharacterized protein PHALS_13043 [Plasmopara halstedii]|uniref:Uncharacterized protein n=1 Tax=Plasmopara halstedii TaxID=4781 RepID=A0A0P1AP44_PLAHL|nr:uncharacterized protein PHALS_13043 [Plasmopara halstedii]CEG42797.1 hypothetical protein PHALS_13043 [Plasmopara halstedii]|eukprot:XP_024579166.1 hypothetical protein PHALS_13043 [Plasmopara halstedii]
MALLKGMHFKLYHLSIDIETRWKSLACLHLSQSIGFNIERIVGWLLQKQLMKRTSVPQPTTP